MRLQQYLKELYLSSLTVSMYPGKQYTEIFVNPSRKELMEIARDATKERQFGDPQQGMVLRFLVDIKKKKVYAWPVNVMHGTVWDKIGDNRRIQDETIINGVAKLKGGKFEMATSDEGVKHVLPKYPPEKWKFVEKYIRIMPFLEKEYKKIDPLKREYYAKR